MARRSLEGTRGVPALLAAAKPEPAEEDLFDKALGLVDERSGFKGARQAISSLIDGDYGSALLSAAFAIPVGGKFLKGGKYAAKGVGWLGRTGAGKALMGRARKVLRRVLREERGGTLPAHAAFNPASPPSKIRGYA